MKTLTNRIMKNTFAIITVLCLIGLQGCDWGGTGMSYPYPDATAETNTPTGCLKSKGRYYDPKLKTCVQVDNRHQALVLDSYRYVNKLAEEGKLQEVEYDINLKKYSTVEKAESLWSELREKGAKMLILDASLPTGRGYVTEPGQSATFEGPKIWGGPDVAAGCGWDHRFSPQPKEDTVKSMILAGIEGIESDIFKRTLPEQRKAIFEDNDCRIRTMSVMANPAAMRDFWNRHLDDIEGIQPQITILDHAQPALGPTQPLKEGE